MGILNSLTWPTTAEERRFVEKAEIDTMQMKRKLAMKLANKGAAH
jgi:hypothetical protein